MALGVIWAAKHFHPYLYGHQCDVFTEHVALKFLLCTPQPFGKLVRWGMAIQELHLHIHHRSGKKNTNADALSWYPVSRPESAPFNHQALEVVAVTSPSWESEKGGEPTLSTYLEKGELPVDDKRACELALTKSPYMIVDYVLFWLESDKTLRVIPPTSQREKIYGEAHGGRLGAHLFDANIFSELSRHYWWPWMRSDIIW